MSEFLIKSYQCLDVRGLLKYNEDSRMITLHLEGQEITDEAASIIEEIKTKELEFKLKVPRVGDED